MNHFVLLFFLSLQVDLPMEDPNSSLPVSSSECGEGSLPGKKARKKKKKKGISMPRKSSKAKFSEV